MTNKASAVGQRGVVAHFQQVYLELRHDTLDLLEQIYADDIVFQDPIHRIEGLVQLKGYFARMYAGVEAIDFDYGEVLAEETQAMLTWTMRMTHRRLRAGEELSLPGATHIRFGDARVHYHRDYFDAGALLYERIPVLGGVVRAIRRRV